METIYGNQNPAPWAVSALTDHSGFDQAVWCKVDDDLLEGTFRNRKRAPVLVIDDYDKVPLRTSMGISGKNRGCT